MITVNWRDLGDWSALGYGFASSSISSMSSNRRPAASLSEAERLVLRRALAIVDSSLEGNGEAEASCSSRGPASGTGEEGADDQPEATPRRRCRSEQERRAIPRNEMSSCQPGASEL